MLLNFGDRTRTGVFSMIWPLTRKAARYRCYDHSSILFDQNLRWTTPDGAGLEALAKSGAFGSTFEINLGLFSPFRNIIKVGYRDGTSSVNM